MQLTLATITQSRRSNSERVADMRSLSSSSLIVASMILAIFCAVGAESWFNRDRAGFDEALLPSTAIGLLVIILGLLQIVLVAASLYAFNQEWHVEEERPIGSGEDYGAGASPHPA